MRSQHEYGAWHSPLTPDKLVEKANFPTELITFQNRLYTLESRPSDGARIVMVDLFDKDFSCVTPAPHNIRTRVHEYGGRCILAAKGKFFFSEFSDGRIYKQKPRQQPEALTPERPLRFADFVYCQVNNCLYSIMESHEDTSKEPVNSVVKIDCETGQIVTVIAGADFYAYPRVSPDGSKISYICWNHPDMPWDSSILHVANIDENGVISNEIKVSGSKDESVAQPCWLDNETLLYISDKTGWYNICKYSNKNSEILCKMQNDFIGPTWQLGKSSFVIIDNSRLFCTWIDKASWNAGIMDVETGRIDKITADCTSYSSPCVIGDNIFFVATFKDRPSQVCSINIKSKKLETIYAPSQMPLERKYVSVPDTIEFDVDKNQKAHAFYYPPKNPDYSQPEGQLPPLIVISHGGPTSMALPSFALSIQFWTTRGCAVVDVNYSGSSGFGREYRNRLKNSWGIVDVRDCEKAARYLIEKKLADPKKIIIRGGSAGGFTTLCALAFTNTFKAGASYFGVSDLEALAKTTHKFESQYIVGLVGKYPQEIEIFRQRSPINHKDKIKCPVIFFQGLLDKVVPPDQSENMFRIMVQKGVPAAWVTYEDEAHGFRKAENIKHSITAEHYFYSKIFGFSVQSDSSVVEIENLK